MGSEFEFRLGKRWVSGVVSAQVSWTPQTWGRTEQSQAKASSAQTEITKTLSVAIVFSFQLVILVFLRLRTAVSLGLDFMERQLDVFFRVWD
jgi:hypothetical protein